MLPASAGVFALPRGAPVSAEIVLRPGFASLADWRAIYRGARVVLDPTARADIEAGAAALETILGEKEPSRLPENGNGAPGKEQEAGPQPKTLSRLFVALKLASLAQGASGIRWELIDTLAGNLAKDLLPPIPAGNITDRFALSLLLETLTGAVAPAGFTPHEKRALTSGTQLTTAAALAGLFEAERAIQSAIVAAALAADGQSFPFLAHPRIHELQRHAGQLEVAAAMRQLLGIGEAERVREKRENGFGGIDTLTPSRLGACLDLLRQAGQTLEDAANAVTESQVVLWHAGETVAGIEDSSSAAMAGDLIAMALREIGDLAKRRISLVTSRPEPARANGNAETGPRAMANAIAGEVRRSSYPTGFDPSGTRRLLPMAGNVMRMLAIEMLLAAERKPPRPEHAHIPCEAARRLLRQAMPPPEQAQEVAPEALVVAIDLVSSGAFADASGVNLPCVVTAAARADSPRRVRQTIIS